MALSKSTIPITFSGGLDQKNSSKLVVPGMFLALENCVRRKNRVVQKRWGFSALSSDVFGSSTAISAGKKIDVFGSDLIMLDGSNLYSYSSANDRWIDKGTLTTALVELDPIVRNGYTQAMADHATLDGITVTVWEDSRGGVRCTIIDDDTGAALVHDTQVSATGTRPKVIPLEDRFCIAYRESTNLKSHIITIAAPTTLGSAQTLAGNVSDSPWDMCPLSTFGLFAYNNSSTSTITVGYVSSTGVAGAPGTNGLPSPVNTSGTGTAANALTIVADAAREYIWIGYHGSAGVVRALTYAPDLSTTGSVDVETIASVRNVTLVPREEDGLAVLFYEISAASVKNHYIKIASAAWTGSGNPTVVDAAASFMTSVGLASKAFEVDGLQFVLVSHDSSLQPTYFLVRQDAFILSRVLGNIGGGHTKDSGGTLKSALPRVMLDQDGQHIVPLQIRNKLTIESGGTTLTSNKGLNRVSLDFAAANYVGATLGQNYHIAGGCLFAYDGVRVVEHGFFIYPEDITKTSPAGGSLSAADHSYRVIYEWTDAQGQIHRSAPSTTITETCAALDKVVLVIPTLRITDRDATDVKIVVYAAVAGQSTVYYRHTETANTTSDTVSVEITTEATTTAEILYTTGGVIEHIAAPAAKAFHVHKNRAFLIGTETGDIFLSKEHVSAEGVAFQDLIRVKVDGEGGRATTGATLDDKLVVFKKDRIYILVGDGPLDTGAQNDYGALQRIAADVGTEIPQSVVQTPVGIMFKSDKGIYLLNRGLATVYIGEGVEDYNDLTITSATVLEDENEVRFTTAEGTCLVYNYYMKQWSTFTNYAAVSACNALNTYLHLTAAGVVNKEVPDQYHDNGVRYAMGIETSWLSFAGVQGYQRVYNMLVLGDLVSHHFTKVKLAYDFETAYNETIYFNTVTGVASGEEYGDGVYGSEDTYGSGSDVYQFEIQPARQKCQSIKLRIEDVDTISTNGGGSFKLEAMTCEVGRKGGANKLSASKKVGSL